MSTDEIDRGRLLPGAELFTDEENARRVAHFARAREVGRSNAVILWKLTPPMVTALKRAVEGRIDELPLPVARGLNARGLGVATSERGTNGSREYPRTVFVLNYTGITLAMSLRPDCAHGYGPLDSCPGCDADEGARREAYAGLNTAGVLRLVADRLETILGGPTVRHDGYVRGVPLVKLVAELRSDAYLMED